MFSRYGNARGVVASPTTRTCDANGPTKRVGITVTFGSVIYLASRFSTSRASSAGVFPVAMTSWTSGIERRPSGRTGTVTDSSGLRQTKTLSTSPGPIWYSAVSCVDVTGAGGNVWPKTHPVKTQPSASAPTRALLPVTPTLPAAPNHAGATAPRHPSCAYHQSLRARLHGFIAENGGRENTEESCDILACIPKGRVAPKATEQMRGAASLLRRSPARGGAATPRRIRNRA